MTATPVPNHSDALIHAVFYGREQIDIALDQLCEQVDEDHAAIQILDGLKARLGELIRPFMNGKPIPSDIMPNWTTATREELTAWKVYIPSYSDGRSPYSDTEVDPLVILRTWHLPPGYPSDAPDA